ncbi:MAG: acylphosphatase [Bacteroidota bacterium]|nr:acylphosphatase [Bacteroidota bacterium]
METVHLLISGKVQGVFFRDSSRMAAQKLKITGWIKNRQDGKVEAMISGEEKNVKAFVDWCKSGPERAKVEEVIVSTKEKTSFEKFEIKRH